MEFEFGDGALGESHDAECPVSGTRILASTEADPEAPDLEGTLAEVAVMRSKIAGDDHVKRESLRVAVPTKGHIVSPRPRSRIRRYKCQREGCGAFFRRHKPCHVFCLPCRSEFEASDKIEREAMVVEREVARESRTRKKTKETHVDALFLAWKRGELPSGVRVDVKNGRQVLLRDGKRSYTRYLKKGEVPPTIRIFNATSA